MQIIYITKGEIKIGGKESKSISYKTSYFSYLGSSLKFGTDNGDVSIVLTYYEIYVNGKLRWKNYPLKK